MRRRSKPARRRGSLALITRHDAVSSAINIRGGPRRALAFGRSGVLFGGEESLGGQRTEIKVQRAPAAPCQRPFTKKVAVRGGREEGGGGEWVCKEEKLRCHRGAVCIVRVVMWSGVSRVRLARLNPLGSQQAPFCC